MLPHMLYKLRPDEMTGQCALDRVAFDIAAAKTHRERPVSGGSAEPVPHELTLKIAKTDKNGKSMTCEDAIPLRPDASLFSPTIPLTPVFGNAATVIHSSAPADFLPSPTSFPPAIIGSHSGPLGAAGGHSGANGPHVGHGLHSHPSAPRLDREMAPVSAVAQS